MGENGYLTQVMTFAWAQLSEAVSFGTANPVIFIPAGIGIVGAAIGLLKRAVRVGGRRR